MADEKPVQAVKLEVVVENRQVMLRLSTNGANPLTIPIDPQAAFETGERLARAAHMARFGTPLQSDQSYLQDQIRRRTTEQYREFLARRIEIMLNSLREDKTWSNAKLGQEVVDQVLTKVT